MRFLLLIIILANAAVFALGKGYFGTPPSHEGQQPDHPPQIHALAVSLGQPQVVQD